MYEYKCKILRVVDGDTVDVDIDLGFGVWMHRERVRMMGIDTPESRTRDKVEKLFGLASKDYLKGMLPIGSMQVLKTQIDKSGEDKKGKFGRILGDFLIDDKKVTTMSRELARSVSIDEVIPILTTCFEQRFNIKFNNITLDSLKQMIGS